MLGLASLKSNGGLSTRGACSKSRFHTSNARRSWLEGRQSCNFGGHSTWQSGKHLIAATVSIWTKGSTAPRRQGTQEAPEGDRQPSGYLSLRELAERVPRSALDLAMGYEGWIHSSQHTATWACSSVLIMGPHRAVSWPLV